MADPSPASGEAPAPAGERRERKGWLAGLPPIPEPVAVEVNGLRPRSAFTLWLAVALGVLVLGIGLNWFLTGGAWVPPQQALQDTDAAYGDTPVQFLTGHPFDVLTAVLFVVSVAVLAISLVTPAREGGPGRFRPVALAIAGAAAALLAAALVAQHFWPGRSGLLSAGVATPLSLGLAGLALALALIGRYREALARRRHEVRAAGWVLFALHWAATGMYYFIVENGDWVNMLFAYASVFLLAYFAYQELVSRSLGADNKSLRFLAGAIVIAATVWFAFLRVEFLSQWLIETVANHTLLMLQAFGQDVQMGTDGRTGFLSAISYQEAVAPRTVIIILACTAIQSMMIFVAAALAVSGASWGRRLAVIAITAPLVYVLNLLRNTGIIIMWADRWLETTWPGLVGAYASFGAPDVSSAAFSIAHNWVGKGGSLVALVLIAILVFRLLPEVLQALVGVLDLPRRRGPLEQHWRALRGLKDDTPAKPAAEPEPAAAPSGNS